MKITEFEIIKVPPSWVWLLIHTNTEHVGIGEPYLENHPESVIAEVKRLEQFLIGQDPTQIEKLWRIMYESGSGYVGGPITMSAISGIDIALWDIAGKAAGLPIYKMLIYVLLNHVVKNKVNIIHQVLRDRIEMHNSDFKMTFSYGRALQQSALKYWSKNQDDINGTQEIFNHRTEMCTLAAKGQWKLELEKK